MTSRGFALEKSAPATNRIDEEACVIKMGCCAPASVAVSNPSLMLCETEMSPAARMVRSAGTPLKRQLDPVAVGAKSSAGRLSEPCAMISTPGSIIRGAPRWDPSRAEIVGCASDI